MSAVPDPPFNPLDWIARNRATFRPPTGSRVVNQDGDFLVMLIAGPNRRDDYHVNPHGEVFYQLGGAITVGTLDASGSRRDVEIGEGELWYCPPDLAHQPRRPDGTYGLVVERTSRPNEVNRLFWLCTRCDVMLHEIVHQGPLTPAQFDALDGREPWRLCGTCGNDNRSVEA